MKSKFVLCALAAAAMVLPAAATVTIQTAFGAALTSAGANVPAGTLWILVGDTNASGSFAGITSLNSGVTASTVSAFQVGQALTLGGTLGGDTIFAMGGFSTGDGITADTIGLTLGVNGVTAGQNYAFYFFPGVTYTGNSAVVGTQVGGVHHGPDVDGGVEAGMTIPADGANVNGGAISASLGGATPNAQFTAVPIPEPSVALLGLLGAFGLVRRRR